MAHVIVVGMAHPAQHPSPRPARSTWSLPQLHQWLVVPLIVVLLTATVGRMLVVTPEVGAREAQVLEGLQILRTGALDALALTLHHVFSTPGALAVLAALTAWLAVRRRRPWDAAGFAVTALCGWAAVAMLKVAVGRPRPEPLLPADAAAGAEAVPAAEPLVVVEGLTSFPSGHTGAAVAIAAAFCLAMRRSGRAPVLLVAGLGTAAVVAWSRLYLGVHYPLDVLASFPVAWAGLAVGCGLANILVPALAYGYGWRQEGVEQVVEQSEQPAGSPAEPAHPRTDRVPVVARREDRSAA